MQANFARDGLAVDRHPAGAIVVHQDEVVTVAPNQRVLARNGRVFDDNRVFVAPADCHYRRVERVLVAEYRPATSNQCRAHPAVPFPVCVPLAPLARGANHSQSAAWCGQP